MLDKETKYYLVLLFVGDLEKNFSFNLIEGKFFQKLGSIKPVCACMSVCFNCSATLCWHRYSAIILREHAVSDGFTALTDINSRTVAVFHTVS